MSFISVGQSANLPTPTSLGHFNPIWINISHFIHKSKIYHKQEGMCVNGDSPHFIHQAIHFADQPLVFLLELDKNTAVHEYV